MTSYIDLDSVWRDRQASPNPLSYELSPKQVDTWIKAPREIRPLPQNANERPLDFMSDLNILGATLPYPRIEIFATLLIEVDSIVSNTFTYLGTATLADGDVLITSSPGYATSNGVQRNVEYHVVGLSGNTFQLSLDSSLSPVDMNFTDGTGLGLVFAVLDAASDASGDYAAITGNLAAAVQLLDFPRIYLDLHSKRYNDIRLINTIDGKLGDARFVLVLDKIQFNDTLQPVWLHYKSHGTQVMRFKRDDPVIVRFMSRDGTTINFFTEPDLSIPTNPDKQSLITVSVVPYVRDARFQSNSLDPI